MKKIIALLLALCLTLLCTASCGKTPSDVSEQTQSESDVWKIEQTVDEFGDVTDDSVPVITAAFEGTFSNTATENSTLTAIVTFEKKSGVNHYIAGFDLKEYNSTSAVYSSNTPISFKMKVNDTIESLDVSGTAPNGLILAGKEEYSWTGDYLFNTLYDGNDIRCIISIGSSDYSFTVLSANLSGLCKIQNITKGENGLTKKEAVQILIDDKGIRIPAAQNWFNENYKSLEQMDSESITQNLKGLFLSIGLYSNHMVNEYEFPFWEILDYSIEKNKTIQGPNYNFDNSKTVAQYFVDNAYKGVYKRAVLGLRKWSDGLKGIEEKASVENDLLRIDFGDVSFYQCWKLSNDIFVLCRKDDDGSFFAYRLLLPCKGDTQDEIIEAITYAEVSLVPAIPE